MSTLESCSSASEIVKFGGGSRSPCILKKIILLLSTTALKESNALQSTDVLSFSSLAGIDTVAENSPSPTGPAVVTTTPRLTMKFPAKVSFSLNSIDAIDAVQLKVTFESGSRAAW